MAVITIELDIVFENDISEIAALFENTGIDVEIIEEVGPGGGWPVCGLTGEESVIREWLLENYCTEDELNYWLGYEY